MKVGFDIDGVLYPWHELIWLYYSKLPEYKLINESKFWNVFVPQMDEDQINEMLNLPFYDVLPPYPDTILLIKMLQTMNADIYYISSRPVNMFNLTEDWFEKYNLPFLNLYFTVRFSKSDVIKQLGGLDFYFEDQLKHSEDITKNTDTLVFLRDRVYNNVFYEYKNVLRYEDSRIDWVILTMLEKEMQKKGIS